MFSLVGNSTLSHPQTMGGLVELTVILRLPKFIIVAQKSLGLPWISATLLECAKASSMVEF